MPFNSTLKHLHLITLSLYRAPAGDFNQFIKNLDDALIHVYKLKSEFLVCGNINTDYLIKNNRKKKTRLITNNIQSVTQIILQQEFKATQELPLITYLWKTVE